MNTPSPAKRKLKPIDRIRDSIKTYGWEDREKCRAAFKSAVSDGTRDESFSQSDADLLNDIQVALESWIGDAPSSGSEALERWINLLNAGRRRLPSVLFQVLLTKLPKLAPKSFEWAPLLLEKPDKELLEMLLDRHIMKATDMVRVAKARPTDFYRSFSLDLLLERRRPIPRTVWGALATDEDRPEGLLSAEEALAESFAVDASADACKWMTMVLAKNPRLRQPILTHLLRDPPAALRLVRYLSAMGMSLDGKRKRPEQVVLATIIADLLPLCESAVVDGKRTANIAKVLCETLLLSASAMPSSMSEQSRLVIEEVSTRLFTANLARALRILENHPSDSLAREVVALRVHDFYAAVQVYLRGLTQGSADQEGSPERALRYERYLGRREVLEGLLTAVNDLTGESRERDAIEAVLFNAGVRPLGASEGVASFDPHLHEPISPGILPRDPVTIVRPGWCVGVDESLVVMQKATVKSVDNTDK